MRRLFYLMICLPILLLTACDVHEWPETPEFVKLHLCLNYETEMTEWKHMYDGSNVIEVGLGKTYDNHQDDGKIRYVVRTYPISEGQRTSQNYTQEFVFTKDITKGYDHEVTLDVLPGNYNVMVWSDLVKNDDDTCFYNAENFAEIMLQGEHRGNSDHRDAFCGQDTILLSLNSANQINRTINIRMKRPLAKFEIVANDLLEFIGTKGSDINLYKVKIQYIGFVPNTYSLFADRPVASTTGVMFESTLTKLTDAEVSMGFDYVFVSDKGTTVTVRIGLYDKKDQPISFSNPITIPIKPDHHTLLTGRFLRFLMMNASNEIDIDPNFGGDYNIIL